MIFRIKTINLVNPVNPVKKPNEPNFISFGLKLRITEEEILRLAIE